MRVIRQDPEHRYVDLDDVFHVGPPIVSVTTALKVLPEFQKAYRFATPYAKALGTAVHAGCDLINRCATIDPASIAPEVRPYLEAWGRVLRELGLTVRASELVVWHPTLHYAGTLDLLASRHGAEVITELVDIKTSAPALGARLAGPQTAAYLQGWHLNPWAGPSPAPTIRRWSAHLAKDGSYRIVSHDNFADDWSRFTEALYTWRRQ